MERLTPKTFSLRCTEEEKERIKRIEETKRVEFSKVLTNKTSAHYRRVFGKYWGMERERGMNLYFNEGTQSFTRENYGDCDWIDDDGVKWENIGYAPLVKIEWFEKSLEDIFEILFGSEKCELCHPTHEIRAIWKIMNEFCDRSRGVIFYEDGCECSQLMEEGNAKVLEEVEYNRERDGVS